MAFAACSCSGAVSEPHDSGSVWTVDSGVPDSGTPGNGVDAGPASYEWSRWRTPSVVRDAGEFVTANGVVHDDVTGLDWDVQSADAGLVSYLGAKQFCDELVIGALDDWRLPTLIEASTIMNYFDYHPASGVGLLRSSLWTNSPVVNLPGQVWTLASGASSQPNAIDTPADRFSGFACVRSLSSGSAPPSRYAIDVDTVLDTITGLTWQRVAPDPKYIDHAQAYCGDLQLGGSTDWRLPTIRELQTLVSVGESPSFWVGAFTGRNDGLPYYSSTIDSTGYQQTRIWSVQFDGQYAGRTAQSDGYYYGTFGAVRCVHD